MTLMITCDPLGGSTGGVVVAFGRVLLAQPSVVVVPPATASASRTGRSFSTLAIPWFVLFMIRLLHPGGRSCLDLVDDRDLPGHSRCGSRVALGGRRLQVVLAASADGRHPIAGLRFHPQIPRLRCGTATGRSSLRCSPHVDLPGSVRI